jgi:hypothetical protein
MKQIITLIGFLWLILQPISAQNSGDNAANIKKAKAKVTVIRHIVPLDATQQQVLLNAYIAYCISLDSIPPAQQQDKKIKEKWQRKVNRHWQATLMETLSDEQRFTYLTTVTKPQVDSLVTVDMNILKQCNLYSTNE